MDGEWKVKGSGRFEVEGGEKEGERRETEKAVLLGFTGQLTNWQLAGAGDLRTILLLRL
jgi:hypothetical protein